MPNLSGPDNAAIADRLDALAGLVGLAQSGRYAARAYRRAAELIRSLPTPVSELVRAGRARELRGIGPGIEARLRELVETGTLSELADLEREMAKVARNAGPQPGLVLSRARDLVEGIAVELGGEPAGDPRRGCELSHSLAVVVSARAPAPVLDRFAALPHVVLVTEREERRALGLTSEGVPVELHVPPPECYGTELVRATGSPAYIEALGELPDAPDEQSLFRQLGLPWCPPELRELGAPREPPPLVELGDIKADLHIHTTWSDGKASVLEMATAARDLGYEAVAICDHTPNVRVVPGLDAEGLRRQADEIATAAAALAPFRVLRGAECDIRADGSLDLPDDILAELDWVQLSLHAGQRQRGDELTRKVVDAMRHPAVRCLSHPKGRILNHRPPNDLDLERVAEVALETGVAIEINGLPDRLDLSAEDARVVLAAGVPLVCSTDAHSVQGLRNMRLSVATARRAGATAEQILNTRPPAHLLRN